MVHYGSLFALLGPEGAVIDWTLTHCSDREVRRFHLNASASGRDRFA